MRRQRSSERGREGEREGERERGREGERYTDSLDPFPKLTITTIINYTRLKNAQTRIPQADLIKYKNECQTFEQANLPVLRVCQICQSCESAILKKN